MELNPLSDWQPEILKVDSEPSAIDRLGLWPQQAVSFHSVSPLPERCKVTRRSRLWPLPIKRSQRLVAIAAVR